jgi:hypothetical protein
MSKSLRAHNLDLNSQVFLAETQKSEKANLTQKQRKSQNVTQMKNLSSYADHTTKLSVHCSKCNLNEIC